MVEPRPDIHELFCYYNSLYFSDALGACIVSWDPRLTSMAASCDCVEEGLCEIQLSVPLLKCRSSADIKNILLHEMIHAFLWIMHKNSNHSDHGSKFWNIANSINSNSKDDNQRPCSGYNINIHHDFQYEEITDITHLWMCASCGDSIKREINKEPSLGDCIEKNVDNNCGNLSCGWHMHMKLCPGRYEKVDDISGLKDNGNSIGVKGKKHKDSSHFNRQNRLKLLPTEEIKDKRVVKRPRIMAEYLLSGDDKLKNLGKKSSQTDCSNSNQCTMMDLRNRSLAMGPEIPRQPRTTCKKICNIYNSEEVKCIKREREISLVIPILDVYTDEESEEDLQPLINKRSEWRKRMKLFNNSDGKGEQATGLTPPEVISLD